jgi:PAS domain S-box-containing protein
MLFMFKTSSLLFRLAGIAVVSLLPFLLVQLFHQQLYAVMTTHAYLIFHNTAELFSIIVSYSIFGVAWFSYQQSQNRHSLFLASVFLGIGLLDFMHTLSFTGMPDFFTVNSTDKTIQYWLAARLFMAGGFLVSAFIHPNSNSIYLSKHFLLSLNLMIPALAFCGIIFFSDTMPVMFIEGTGLTAFKKNCEYGVIFLLCLSIIAYWRRMQKTGDLHLEYFLAAFIVCMLSELAFSVYKSVFDTYNLLGHLYKIIAFYLIYRGMFISSINMPYLALATANSQLSEQRATLEQRVLQRTAELACSEARLQANLENAPNVAIQWYDLSGRVLYWNPASERLFGWKKDLAIGKTLDVLMLSSEANAKFLSILARIQEEGLAYGPYEVEFHNRDGRRGWALSTVFAIPLTDEQLGFVCMDVDITERKTAEKALRRSQERLNEAQRIAQLGNWELNLQDNTLFWSDEIFHIFEIDSTRFSATYEAFLAAIHPEDRDAVNAAYSRSLENHLPYAITHRLQMADGRIKYVHEQCQTFYTEAGKPFRSIGTVQDVTERKLAEAELEQYRNKLEELISQRTAELRRQQVFIEAVLANVSDGIVACDESGILSYFNNATRKLHGIEQNELPPEQWAAYYRLMHADGITPMTTEEIPLFRAFQGEQVRDQLLVIEHISGSKYIVVCTGQPMFDKEGVKIGAVVSMHDVTLQKMAEASLIHARDAAEAANRAKSVFLANMSHELRTPLNAILGFSELMAQDATISTKQKETLDIINRSGRHLLSMINDVLDISKIEASRLEVNNQAFDLLKLLHDISDMIKVRAAKKQLNFSLEISPDVPRFIKTDSGKLRQVLINLLGNAIKFTAQGCIILRTHVSPLSAVTMVMLEIEVIDSGRGIPQNRLHELFQPFVQLARTDSGLEGTGLGLTISKSLVELLGGKISVSSILGEGSTFKIELPVTLADANEVETETQNQSVTGLAADQPAWRLLVVDDNAENRLLLESLLTQVGFQVEQANNGQEAIDKFMQWQPHLIWMDMQMPIMDGYQASIRIRQLPDGAAVKIIAVTASAFQEQHSSMIEAGCDAVIHKPFQSTEIFSTLTKHLGVKFIYQAPPVGGASFAIAISADKVSQLPEELRRQLRQAALNLDIEATETLISQILGFDPDMAAGLQSLVNHYQFEQISQLAENPVT